MKLLIIPFVFIVLGLCSSCNRKDEFKYKREPIYSMKNDTLYKQDRPIAVKIKTIDRYDKSRIIYVKHL